MRILLMLASMTVVASGAFCIANSSAPFMAVAFVVGIAVLVLGAVEFAVSRLSEMKTTEKGKIWIGMESVVSIILGTVFLFGQITDDVAITAVFALWTTIEGLKSISSIHMNFRTNSVEASIEQIFGIITTLLGIYMFFNVALINVRVLLLIGMSLVLIGLSTFKLAVLIERREPEFLTGTEEKLRDAQRDERNAMDKAKQAIRERNDARLRIEKYSNELEREGLLPGSKTADSANNNR